MFGVLKNMPRLLEHSIHSDFNTGLEVWSGYKQEIIDYYDSGINRIDLDDHLTREYNRKISNLGLSTGLLIQPFDAGFRYIGSGIFT